MPSASWRYCAPEAEWWLKNMSHADPNTPVRRINVYWKEDKSDGHRVVFYQRGGVPYVWDNHGGERKMAISKEDIMYPTQVAQRMYGDKAKVAEWAKDAQDGVKAGAK